MTTPIPYFPFTLTSNSIIGRLSPNTGSPESIPFSALAIALALNATSTTSLTIGTGSKTLIVQTNLPISVGQYVVIANTAAPTNYMFGQVTAYSSTTGSLTVNVTSTGGSGTIATWTVSATGPAGATGTAGASGSIPIGAAGGTVDAITVTISGPSTADQQVITVVSAGVNTSATPTLKLNTDALHTITTRGGKALKAGDIGPAGYVGIYEYNLANTRWELLNPVKGLGPVIKVATFDTASATGTKITVTGVGFKPALVGMILGFTASSQAAGVGFSDGTLEGCWLSQSGITPGNSSESATLGTAIASAGVSQVFSIATGGSMDADGCTVQNTKNGAPAGTIAVCLIFWP